MTTEGARPQTATASVGEQLGAIQTSANTSTRPQTAQGTYGDKLYHYVPRFNVYGEELPRGKGTGLKPRGSPDCELPGSNRKKVVFPAHWASSDNDLNGNGNRPESQWTESCYDSHTLDQIDWRAVEKLQQTDHMRKILSEPSASASTKTRMKLLSDRRRANVKSLEAQRVRIRKSREDTEVLWFHTIPLPQSTASTTANDAHQQLSAQIGAIRDQSGTSTRSRDNISWKVGCPETLPQTKHKTLSALIAARQQERRDPMHATSAMQNVQHPGVKMRGPRQAPFAEDVFHDNDTVLPMTRSKLIRQRQVAQRDLLETARQRNDNQCAGNVKKFLGFDESDVPWWLRGRPQSAPAGSQLSQQHLTSDALHTRSISSGGGQGRGKRDELTGKVTRRSPHEVSSGFGERIATLRFTDAVLEMELENQNVVLDDQGKCIKVKPCENDPMYSSFTPDGKFLEPRERRRMERDKLRNKHEEPFSRLCAIGPIKARAQGSHKQLGYQAKSREDGRPAPIPEVKRTTRRVGVDNRRTTALIAEPNYATLLREKAIGSFRRRSSPIAVGLEVGIRTGGFQITKTSLGTSSIASSKIVEECSE